MCIKKLKYLVINIIPQSQIPAITDYTNLVCQKDYVIYRNLFFLVENIKLYIHAIFQVNWLLLSKVIKGKQKIFFLDLDQNFDLFATILLITAEQLGQISNIHQPIELFIAHLLVY